MSRRWSTAALGAMAAVLGAGALAGAAEQARATTYTVTNTSTSPFTISNPTVANPDYLRSLPFAIQAANLHPGHDTIRFDIPGAGVHTIRPRSTLEITDPLTIDGYSQPSATPATAAAAAAPKIVIDAQNVDHALHVTADDSDIRGLVVTNAYANLSSAAAILLEGDRNRIAGNHIGTDADGLVRVGNDRGVEIRGDENVIGGAAPDARNLISDNLVGLEITSGSGNLIQGNRIGSDATGSADLGNGVGVLVHSAENTIGGGEEGEGNLISGQSAEGIELRDDGADSNIIQGNLIGTNADGDAAIGNTDGIDIEDGDDNLIGGPGRGDGNVIAGSSLDGIDIAGLDGSPADRNVVQGNLIGVGANGLAPLPNGTDGLWGTGIWIQDGHHNTIGGTEPGAGNVIAHSAYDGIVVYSGTDNAFHQNSIYDNGELGIDLANDGVTDNDPPQDLDADAGANELQNFPQITSASFADGRLSVNWVLDSLASTTFRIEFFGNRVCDDSGYGEGTRFLHGETVTTDANGHAAGSFSTARWAPFFWFPTGTATISEGAGGPDDLRLAQPSTRTSTSEFSPCFNDITL